jgi:hypothetical protein
MKLSFMAKIRDTVSGRIEKMGIKQRELIKKKWKMRE